MAMLMTISELRMKALPRKDGPALAEEMGWTQERVNGYMDGERYRREKLTLSMYHRVGIDEYALGFRTGYYEQNAKPVFSESIKKASSAN